jgi:hypothetical protein
MVVTGNLTTSIIWFSRRINNFAFSIPASNGPSLICIDNISDSISSRHVAEFSGMSKVHCAVCCNGRGMRNEHLGSPPRLKAGNRILVFVPIAVNSPECDHHVQHNRAAMYDYNTGSHNYLFA